MEARVARAVLCVLVVIAGLAGGTTVAAASTERPVGLDADRVGEASDRTTVGHDPTPSDAPDAGDGSSSDAVVRAAPTDRVGIVQQDENDSSGSDAGGTENGTADDETAGDGNETGENETTIDGYDEVHVEIALQGNNGTATWTVQYRYRLDSENGSDSWRTLRRNVEERPDAYIERFEERWTGVLERTSEDAGREMELTDFAVATENASGVQEYGFVTFTFRWSAFAHVELNRIAAGDALEGFVLDDRTQLVFTWPEAYNATSIEPAPDEERETTVIWHGTETEFVEGEPRVELMHEEGDSNATPAGDGDALSVPWMAALGIAVLAIVGVAGWWVRGDRVAGLTGRGVRDGPTDPGLEESDAAGAADPPRELLSNEERVLRLLRENGGRIKQQEVVSELDWTEAKTSQVVGELRESDRIEVFRIGRENVLSLPANESETAVGSSENDSLE